MVSQTDPKSPESPQLRPPLVRRPQGLGDEVYNVLFSQIMSLQIAPGARITIDALARDLGVSHTPIREALGRLENEGLIHKTHLVGYRAAQQLSAKQFDDLYALRLLIEPTAAAQAAQNMSDEALAELESLARQMTEGGQDARAYGLFAQFDKTFHDEIARAGGNAYIEGALSSLHTHVHLFRLMYHSEVTREALKEHAAIIAAIKDRDPARAAKAMRTHIAKSQSRFQSKFDGAIAPAKLVAPD